MNFVTDSLPPFVSIGLRNSSVCSAQATASSRRPALLRTIALSARRFARFNIVSGVTFNAESKNAR